MFLKAKNKNEQQERKEAGVRLVSNQETKSSIDLAEDEDDPCAPRKAETSSPTIFTVPGLDPRFQQQDQTLRCYVTYTDFFHCEHLLGEGHEACAWFQATYKSICPNAWIERWDEYRSENRMPWRGHGPFGKLSNEK